MLRRRHISTNSRAFASVLHVVGDVANDVARRVVLANAELDFVVLETSELAANRSRAPDAFRVLPNQLGPMRILGVLRIEEFDIALPDIHGALNGESDAGRYILSEFSNAALRVLPHTVLSPDLCGDSEVFVPDERLCAVLSADGVVSVDPLLCLVTAGRGVIVGGGRSWGRLSRGGRG